MGLLASACGWTALQRERSVAVHARWAGLGAIQLLPNGSVVEVNFPRISCLFAVLQGDL